LTPPPDRPSDTQTPACPCGHDNVPAELTGQHPLLERAAAGDREAFAQLYDTQVDGIYRYLLAWTADPAQAAALTAAVFHGAFSWLTVTHITDTEAAAWLTAMARDAVVQRRRSGATPGTADPVAAVAQLSDPKREVVVLRLLCGHSLDHTAHLSGFTRRAVLELQLSACLSLWELTSGSTAPAPQEAAAEEFEQHLAQGNLEPSSRDATAPSGPHAALTGPVAVAQSLHQTAPGHVVGPDPALVERLRQSLLTGTPPDPPPVPLHPATRPHPVPGTHPVPGGAPRPRARGNLARRSRGPRTGRVAGLEAWWVRLSTGLAESRLLRRPWLATGVATAGIVVVLTLQAFGDPAPPGACGGRPCPPTTTVAAVAAAGAGSLGTPRTTVLQPSTTTSTVATPAPPPSAPRTSAATTPPSSRPATTAPPTTAPPRPTTTTRATTTTAPTTTVATTTTAAPAPT
jgi:DNA-directed RNA polymerase specialized sigma24 family protein